ncbi:anaphase-promoting complex subunit 5-domain containing protein [Nitzschia inconspicua]|uniref:Anaphase-promoting complex subunit 5 n=1 Tax=Nitzschia inconspicua TaxID=303405 RepID=A0A9K3PZM1_9STRA|nr:anaphase-promoting complex subunit 5-domain containing protein [Nitzschia inconspicua]
MAERPNPFSIGVCALIALHSDPNSSLQDLKVPRRTISTFLEETVRDNGIGQTPQRNHDDVLSLEQWMAIIDDHMGCMVAEIIMNLLHMAAESVDALVDLFDSLSLALQQGLVDPTSVHGMYLRKVRLGFDELSFEAVTMLWRALKERVNAIQDKMHRQYQEEDEDENQATFDFPKEWTWPLSTEQLQEILRQECLYYELDQENSNPDVGNGKRRPPRARHTFEQMEVHIRKMLNKDPALPAAYFLRYLNCLRNGERVGALDALHQYFDNTLVHQSNGKSGQEILQFSAILLAMTHSSFGDSELALMATEEAVRVAQQSKDAACVAFALGWLFEYQGQGTTERRQLLQRCASNANERQLRPLVAGAHLSLARHVLEVNSSGNRDIVCRGGDSCKLPVTSLNGGLPVFNTTYNGSSLWQASWAHLQEVTSEPMTDQRMSDRPTFLYVDPKDTARATSLEHLVAAGTWNEIGLPDMSQAASMAALQSSESLSYDDVVTAIHNLSRVTLYGTFVGNNDKQLGILPSCTFARSIHTILSLRVEFGLEQNNLEDTLLQSIALTLHEWAICRGDLEDARALQGMLDSHLHQGLDNVDQLYFDVQMQKCFYFSRTQNWEKAQNMAKSLLLFSRNTGPLSNQIRVLLVMAMMRLESDPMQCTSALTPLLEALAVADELEMHGLHAVGMSILAKIFLRLQNPSRAVAILNGVLPTLSQKEHIRFQAEAFLTLAKAHLKISASTTKDAKNTDENTPSLKYSQTQQYGKALFALERSSNLFKEAQDIFRLRECLFLQANVYSILGDLDQREKLSEEFLQLCRRQAGGGKRMSILDALKDPAELQRLVERSMIS